MTRTGDTDLTAQSTSDAHAEAVAAATATAGVQGLLFDDDLRPMPEDVGLAAAAAWTRPKRLPDRSLNAR